MSVCKSRRTWLDDFVFAGLCCYGVVVTCNRLVAVSCVNLFFILRTIQRLIKAQMATKPSTARMLICCSTNTAMASTKACHSKAAQNQLGLREAMAYSTITERLTCKQIAKIRSTKPIKAKYHGADQ